MQAIFSSKLYRSSRRQDKIRAAMANPINQELMQQLRVYLDDEYQTPEYLDPESATEDKQDVSPSKSKESLDRPHVHKDSQSLHKPPEPTDTSLVDDIEELEGLKDPEAAEPAELDAQDVSESTKVTRSADSAIVSQTVLYPGVRYSGTDFSSMVNEIKGLLNLKDDTAGVNRILIKNNEMWIYYEDKINLNNVMSSVIESLSAANYAYLLDFNRLARTDNAIVFELVQNVSTDSTQADTDKS